MMRPRSLSVLTTWIFGVVTRSLPRWPGIFLFLNTLPGSCRLPVEPMLRWLTETPCVARKPPKFHRFMPPAKPLPIDVPGHIDELARDEMIDGDLGADVDHIVLADAEFLQLALGLDLGDGEVAALRLAKPLDLGRADAKLHGGVAMLLRRLLARRPGNCRPSTP